MIIICMQMKKKIETEKYICKKLQKLLKVKLKIKDPLFIDIINLKQKRYDKY
jgi:hypothetical protein